MDRLGGKLLQASAGVLHLGQSNQHGTKYSVDYLPSPFHGADRGGEPGPAKSIIVRKCWFGKNYSPVWEPTVREVGGHGGAEKGQLPPESGIRIMKGEPSP